LTTFPTAPAGPSAADATTIAARWSQQLPGADAFSRAVYWLAIPEVDARYQRRACAGDTTRRWFAHVVDRHLGPTAARARMLSLGCGAGGLERKLHALGAFARFDAFDVAPSAIDAARRDAAAAGMTNIDYQVRDLQRDGVPRGAYDAAWFNGSLHHIERLEFVLDEVRDSLAPDGWLFVNEYVGANAFGYGPRQRECIAAAFRLLPPRLRRSCIAGDEGRLMDAAPLPDPDEVRRVDPSEAVRSEDILPAIEARFDIVERNDCGGTLLQFLLAGIAGNFRSDDAEAMRYLEMLFAIEDALIDGGELASDFVVLAARPKPKQARAS
jgi:SAM-dependent methyltransferase